MEDTLTSSIQKIIREEKEQDKKLKEKREFESKLSNLNKAISRANKEIELLQKVSSDKLTNLNVITSQLEVAQIRRNAHNEQVNFEENTLLELRRNIENVQEHIKKLQVTLCDSARKLSDECDIWALMNKPLVRPIPSSTSTPLSDSMIVSKAEIEQRLQKAIERKNNAISERNLLLSQPESGEEFIRHILRVQRMHRFFSTKVEVINENEPIKFSTSPAAKRQVTASLKSDNKHMPWYQPYIVSASVAVFLVYFCILREENDIDKQFTKTLYERIEGLEKEQLLLAYRFNKENGMSVEDIEKRLKEIEAEEKAALKKHNVI